MTPVDEAAERLRETAEYARSMDCDYCGDSTIRAADVLAVLDELALKAAVLHDTERALETMRCELTSDSRFSTEPNAAVARENRRLRDELARARKVVEAALVYMTWTQGESDDDSSTYDRLLAALRAYDSAQRAGEEPQR